MFPFLHPEIFTISLIDQWLISNRELTHCALQLSASQLIDNTFSGAQANTAWETERKESQD